MKYITHCVVHTLSNKVNIRGFRFFKTQMLEEWREKVNERLSLDEV